MSSVYIIGTIVAAHVIHQTNGPELCVDHMEFSLFSSNDSISIATGLNDSIALDQEWPSEAFCCGKLMGQHSKLAYACK